MAEAVGTIASGIAIAGLAGQVAVLVTQLKGVWDQIKDAPSDIQHLFEQLDCLSLVLVQIKVDQPLPDALFDTNILNQSLLLCQRAEAELRVLAKELEEQIKVTSRWKKRLGSLKAILRKEDIKRLKSRLETTISLLSLAHQCHISGMVQMQYDLCLNRLPSTANLIQSAQTAPNNLADGATTCEEVSTSTEVTPKARNIAQQTFWTSQQTPLGILIGSLKYRKKFQKHKGKSRNALEVIYQLPTWMSYQTWNLLSHKALSGWKLNLSTYRTLPENHIIFQCARDGNLDLMREILSTHEGYVSDRSIHEWTPLHVAVYAGHLEMCRLLINEGADVLSMINSKVTPLLMATGRGLAAEYGQGNGEILRVLIEAGGSEAMIQDYRALEYYSGDADTFCYLSRQCFPPLDQAPKEIWLDVLHDRIQRWVWRPDWASIVSVMLELMNLKEVANLRESRRNSSILHACSKVFAFNNIPEVSLSLLVGIIRGLVINGERENLSRLDNDKHTPLQKLLLHLDPWRTFNKHIRHLSIWIETLAKAGVDLENYGQTELRMIRQLRRTRMYRSYYRLLTFSYGSRLADWKFWFDPPTGPIYRYSREFWASVERALITNGPGIDPRYPLPGAWPQDEHEDEDYCESEGSDCGERYEKVQFRRIRKARHGFLVKAWRRYENPEELEAVMCTSRFSLLVLSRQMFIEALIRQGLGDVNTPEDNLSDDFWSHDDSSENELPEDDEFVFENEYEEHRVWANAIGKRCKKLLNLDEVIVSQVQNDFERQGISWAVSPLTYESIPESGLLRLSNVDLPPLKTPHIP